MFDSNRNKRRDDQRLTENDKFVAESSHNLTLQAANPWEQDSRWVTGVKSCLFLADKIGISVPKSGSQVGEKLSQLPSMKLIALQREITSKNKALHQVRQKIAAMSLEAETTDFLHCRVIEKRTDMVNQLCTDLDLVLKNMDLLLHQLLQPFVGDHIRMDAAYHKCAQDVFRQLFPTLNDLTVHMNNITWTANSHFSSSQLEPLRADIQSLSASVQMSCQVLSQMNKGTEKLSGHAQDVSKWDITSRAGHT